MATAMANYIMIVMDAKGSSSKGMPMIRQEAIANLLEDEAPVLVFVQEFKWKDIHKRGWRDLHVPDYYQYIGHNEAGFIVDRRELTVTRQDDITAVISIHENMREKKEFGKYAELSRMCICLVESKGVTGFKVLCISWNGPDLKSEPSRKEEVMRSFAEFIRLLKDEYKLQVIVGGYFNMEAELVGKCLQEPMRVITPSPEWKNMMLVDEDQDLVDTESLETREWDTLKETPAFYHTPLKIAISVYNHIPVSPSPPLDSSSNPIPVSQYPPLLSSSNPIPVSPSPPLDSSSNPIPVSPSLDSSSNSIPVSQYPPLLSSSNPIPVSQYPPLLSSSNPIPVSPSPPIDSFNKLIPVSPPLHPSNKPIPASSSPTLHPFSKPISIFPSPKLTTTNRNMFVMNTNGPSSKGMSKIRQEAIANLLEDETPVLVFVQEFNWKNLHQRGWSNLNVPDYYQYIGHNEAGFIFDAREVTTTRQDNIRTVIRIHEQMTRKNVFQEYAELSRMCICLVESKGVPQFKVMCISWHGPHRQYTTSRKEEVMRSFAEFIRLLKDEYELQVIVGGDFNLKAELVERCVQKPMLVITPSGISIDMLLIEGDQDVVESESLESRKWDKLNEKPAFDHTPLKIAISAYNHIPVPASPPLRPSSTSIPVSL